MSRIQITDTALDAVIKMVDGNPGAMSALMDIMSKHDEIDPQAMMGGLGAVMILDTWEIYGADIYVLYNDKCDRDVRKMLMIMRACQMGNFSHSKLKRMASDHAREFNLTDQEWKEQDDWVCNQLEDFQKAA